MSISYFRELHESLSIQMNTNGGARPAEWWRRLARLKVRCLFGIDGLEDTNHVYRQDTHWPTIMRNVSAFLEAGGEAIWEFIVFAHNQHQVNEARELSLKLGFRHFVAKRTARFPVRNGALAPVPRRAKDGSFVGHLSPTSLPAYQNSAQQELINGASLFGGIDGYFASTKISCKAQQDKMVYVSAEGLVFPCCYVGQIYPAVPTIDVSQIEDLLSHLPDGKWSLSAFVRSIPEIVASEFFQQTLPNYWNDSNAERRPRVCARHCGACDTVAAQRAG
jgi:hypothetical protein